MEKNKEVDQGEFCPERFLPILPRPVINSLTSTTTSFTRKWALKQLRSTVNLAKPEIVASSCSLVTSSRSEQAPLASTSYSQIPIMVVNPIQHQKSSVESFSSSTQTISTCAPSNTGAVASSGISSIDSSLQCLPQGQSESTLVQGNFQNYGVVLGNSLPAILPGCFLPNQLIQPSPFLGSVFIPPSIQGNSLQGNLAQGFHISEGLLPVNQFHSGIQNSPQFSSCLQQVPVMNPGICLPAVQTKPLSSIQNTEVVKGITTTVSASSQSSFKFVVETDPEFDKKIKDAILVNNTNVSKEGSPQSCSTLCTITQEENPKENQTSEEESLPKIESCFSMKKLSLKEMMVILNEGNNALTFVKPGTNDYYRAKILCEAMVKYHITRLHSDIGDNFFTSLVSPYISLSEALHLRNEIKHDMKEEEKQKRTGAVPIAKNSTGVTKATGKETAEHILRWKTEKLENFNPELYQQFSAKAKTLQSACSLTGNDTEVTNRETNQKRVNTMVNLSEPDVSEKARKSKTNETNRFLESNKISNTKESLTELIQKTSGSVSESVTESELKLTRRTCEVMNEQGKASEANLKRNAFKKETFENNRSEKVDVQKQVVSRSDVAGIRSKVKQLESDAEVLKDSYRQQIFEKNEISEISKESKFEFTSSGQSERKNQKETLSEADLIRKAFTLPKFRATAQNPFSTNHVSASNARESLPVSQDVNNHHSNKSQNQCYLNDSGKEIIVIKSEPDENMEDLNALTPCESEKKSDYTGLRSSNDESVSSSAPSRKYTLNSENILIPKEPVGDISSNKSSVEQPAFEEGEKSDPCVSTRRPKNLLEISTKNALTSDSGKDIRDEAAEKGQTSNVEEITGAVHLPNEFMLGKWSQSILSINQRFSGDTTRNKSCCYLCGVLFPSERVVWSHILYEHTSASLNSPEYPNFICSHCFQKFDLLSLAQKHEVDVHLCEFPCYFCGLSLDDSFTMLSHVATVHSRLFTCEICQRQFLGKSEFQKHCLSADHKQSKSEISKVVLMCLFCNCKFDSEMALAQHLTSKHRGKPVPNSREFVCQSCRHPFLDASALQNHRSPNARKVDRHRPLSTTSLVTLATQVTEAKKNVDLLRQNRHKRTSASHCMLVDLIRKNTSGNDSGYRELDFKQRKYVYPFEKLLKYCELDSDIAEETAMLIMDELMKFILSQYPLLQLDTGRKDFHNLVVAVSRSQRFTQLLRTLKFKPLAWTSNVKKYVKMFLEKVQASCYRNADFTQLCESLQKSLNFLEESKNPDKQKLPSFTVGYPLTNNFDVVTLKKQKEGNDSLPLCRKTGTVNVAAQAKQKTTEPISHSKAMQVSVQSGSPKGVSKPSMSTVSTCSSSAAALPGFSTQNTSTSYQLVQLGANYVFVPVGKTTIPITPFVQNVTIKGVTSENEKAICSDLNAYQSTVTNCLPATTGHPDPQCSAQKLLNVQSDCNTVESEEGKKKIVTEQSSSNILSDRNKKALKKFVAIAPKAGAPPTNKSKKVTTSISENEMLRKKIRSSNNDTDSGDIHSNEESDSFVESSALLNQWFVKVKKPLTLHNEVKLRPNLNENEDRAYQESRKLVVNKHLKRLTNKKKGFQVADRYRAHISTNSRETLTKWLLKASGKRQEKKRRGVKRKKFKLEQSHDHILRKRKPVSYRYEDENLSDSDDGYQQSSSSKYAESDEEWKPSDEESEEEYFDGMVMKDNKNRSGENNDVVACGAEGCFDFTGKQNKNDFEQTYKKTAMHSGKVQNTRILRYRNGNELINQKELQKDIAVETECDNTSSNCKRNSIVDLKSKNSMPVSRKFSKTFLKDDKSSENTQHLTGRKATVGKCANLQHVNLKRYASILDEEYIPPKILRVANSAASLNLCTKKNPWLSDLCQFLKCCFVKMERCDQADRLGVELLVVCSQGYCERKLTRNFVKQICKEDQDRTKNKMLSQNDLNVDDKTGNRKKVEVTKEKYASSEKKTTSIAMSVRGRGRPRKNLNIVEGTSVIEGRLQETHVNEDNNALSTERSCKALERRRGRPKKKVNYSGKNFKIKKCLYKTEEEEFNEKSDKSFSISRKKLRPRKNLNYFEDDSLEKRESGGSDHNAFLKKSDADEHEGCETGLLRGNSLCHIKTKKAVSDLRETEGISSCKCASLDYLNKEEEMKASFNHVEFSKPDARISPRPDLINVTNKDDVSLTAPEDSLGCDGTDIADFVPKEASRNIKKECVISEDMNEINGRKVFSGSFVKSSDLDVRICPKPDLLNVTNQEDIDLPACIIDLSNSTFNKTGTDYISEGANRLIREESNVSTETEDSMSEQSEEMETNLTILPIHIKQEVDLTDDVSDSIGVSVTESNTSNIMKTVSKSFQKQDIQSICTSFRWKKRGDISSHQLPSSCQTTSCMSSFVSQASSNFASYTSSAYTKQVKEASPFSNRKPEIGKRRKDSKQALSEEMETNLRILPIHIKQEVDLTDDVSDSIGVSVTESNTSNIMKTVSKSFQKQDIQSFCTSFRWKKRGDISSHQLPSSCQTTSCMSSLVSQASSNFATYTSSAYTKQVKEASPFSNRKPEIGKRRKDSKQALSSEPTQAKLCKDNSMQIVNRYPVLFYPSRNSTATSGVSSASPGSAALRAPPPLMMMSTAKSSLTNSQPAVGQTPSLETPASNTLNVQMLSNDLSSLRTLVKNVGENQTQVQTPVPQSAVYFVPVSGTNQFIPVNMLNSVVPTEQLQQTVQTLETNQFQRTGNIQQAPVIQGTPQIGKIPLRIFSNLTCSPVQLSSFSQTSQHQVITNLQPNSQYLQTDVQTSAFQGVDLKQSKGESESTSKNQGPDHQIKPSDEKSSQFSEQESNKQSAVVQQHCQVFPQQGTNQNVILQSLPLAQPVAHIQGLQLPIFQTGQVQIQSLQPAFGMGMLPNQLQGLNQSAQGFQVSQTGVQTLGNESQVQQQKIRMISPQGTSHTLMVNQQMPLAPGQLIYVPNTTGSDAVYSGHVIETPQKGSNAMQGVPPGVNAQGEDTGNKMETMSESLNKQETASSSQAGRKPEHGGDFKNANAQQTGVEAEVEKTQAEDGEYRYSYNQCAVVVNLQSGWKMCSLCSRSFEDASAFSEHYPKHYLEGAYCKPCKHHFKNKLSFEIHNAMRHSLRYVCKSSGCEEVYLTNEKWNDHVKENHSDECTDIMLLKGFRFGCPVCMLQIETWSGFNNHQKKHFGLFRCQICNMELPTEKCLKSHIARKHKTFMVCTRCKEPFVFRHQYEDHVSKCKRPNFCSMCPK